MKKTVEEIVISIAHTKARIEKILRDFYKENEGVRLTVSHEPIFTEVDGRRVLIGTDTIVTPSIIT